jgi:hypothetical protein
MFAQSKNCGAREQSLIANGSETTVVSRQLLGKYVPAATNTHATIGVVLETVFSTRSVKEGYKKDNWSNKVSASELIRGSNSPP